AYELSGLPSFIFGPGYTGDVTGNRSPELPNSVIFGNYTNLPSLLKQASQPRQLSADQKAVLNLVYYGDDDKVRGITNPQLSAARPEEKAALIEHLIDGVTSENDEQSILRILRSEVKNPARFKQIIDIVGMRNLEKNLDG